MCNTLYPYALFYTTTITFISINGYIHHEHKRATARATGAAAGSW